MGALNFLFDDLIGARQTGITNETSTPTVTIVNKPSKEDFCREIEYFDYYLLRGADLHGVYYAKFQFKLKTARKNCNYLRKLGDKIKDRNSFGSVLKKNTRHSNTTRS